MRPKTLKSTLKELYHEVPRNWNRVRCSDEVFNAMRRGAAVILVNQPHHDLQGLSISVDRLMTSPTLLALYRYNDFVRHVRFRKSRTRKGKAR